MGTSKISYPPDLDGPEQEHLLEVVKDWALSRGHIVRPSPAIVAEKADPGHILAVPAPMTLFPSPFPEACFEEAQSVQSAYNHLYAKISQDEDFIKQIVDEVADGDEFIANLWEVHLRVKAEGYTQPLSLGLFRSDYMLHKDSSTEGAAPHVKQVEFNTIASSFGGLSTLTSELHRLLARTQYPYLKRAISRGTLNLPQNEPAAGLACGMQSAVEGYSGSELGHDLCVIFLVQGGERNIFDQRAVEFEFASKNPEVPVFRLPFSEILQRTSIANTSKRQLLYHLPTNPSKAFEVALVYFRSGYGPGDYPDRSAWEARYQLERSAAIKCPTVLTQLAGCKKVQQVLATPKPSSSPSELSRFVLEESPEFKALWGTFTNIYPLDESQAGLQARKMALDENECKRFVVKPQREGGGNNHYRDKIPGFLRSVPESHWGSYILMELITPPPLQNLIMRNGKLEHGGVICELGIYGACLWNNDTKEISLDKVAGYLLRTKGDQSEEGGVAAGFGCMDSCTLV